jgi:hypothetical protein
MFLQAATQASPGDIGTDQQAGDFQQFIEREVEPMAEKQHQPLLLRLQLAVDRPRSMGFVIAILTIAPAPYRIDRDVELLGESGIRFAGRLDIFAGPGRCGCVLVQLYFHLAYSWANRASRAKRAVIISQETVPGISGTDGMVTLIIFVTCCSVE